MFKKSPFSGKQILEAISINRWLIKNSLSWDDVENWKTHQIEETKKNLGIKICPVCGYDSYYTKSLKDNPKGYTRHKFCVNDECCFEEYL